MVATNKINQNFLCCSLSFLSQSTKANYSCKLSKLVPSLYFYDADLHRGKDDDPSCFVRVGQESRSSPLVVDNVIKFLNFETYQDVTYIWENEKENKNLQSAP